MATTDVDALFGPELLGQLESLALLARRLTTGQMRAERRSTRHGASAEFSGFRPFTTGDDWRAIDWNAYARWRQLVLKLFVEEEDLHVHLLLDCSASMDWGSPVPKYDYARQAMAGLAYLTLANLDRAAVAPIGHPPATPWRPSRGRHRFLPLLRYLAACPTAREGGSLAVAVRRWTATRPRPGVAIFVSDLFGTDAEDATLALDALRHARHEVAVLQIHDPAEAEAGERGEYELEEVESGEHRRVIVDPKVQAAYRHAFAEYQQQIARYCRAHGIALLQVSTGLPVAELLKRSLLEGGFVR